MRKFIVGIREVHVNSVCVEAESAEEAKDKAMEAVAEGESIDLEYSHTLDKDLWSVEEATE